jgi:Zn ribbon nucleic-acid-binding protein
MCPKCMNDTYTTLWLGKYGRVRECARCGWRWTLPPHRFVVRNTQRITGTR